VTPERWRKISHLFDAALVMDPEARSRFLDDACAGDSEVRHEVESLLHQQLASVPAVAAHGFAGVSPGGLAGVEVAGYRLEALIGHGAMGEVYRARDIALGRAVAVKILPPLFSADRDRLARFEREARLLASLNHPHVAAIYGIVDADGMRGLVLELVDGETLAERLRRAADEAGRPAPLPLAETIGIARQLADAIDAAHEGGVVHRDLKPANIKVAADGSVKVLDFGLAKAIAAGAGPFDPALSASTRGDSTFEGTILGTIAYMSPEQARGRPVDKRTDIWAFGCVLYEMLTGRLPFDGETATDIIAAIVEREPDWTALPPATPPAVVTLVRRCLEKNPKRRLRDIGDAVFEHDGTGGAIASPVARPAPVSRARERVAWSLLALTLTAVAAAFVWTVSRGDTATAPTFARAFRVTSGPDLDFGPAISPDGKWVAYLSSAGGRTDLWVKFLSGGVATNLTRDTGLELPTRIDIGGLAISPDGTAIAFDAGAKVGTPANLFDSWIIPAPLGGVPRRLVERGRGLRWSPDGRHIAYIRAGAAAGDALYVADADGANEREVVGTRGGMHVHWPAWSPDGRDIYFSYSPSTTNAEPSEIHRVPAAGGQVEPVVTTARRATFPTMMPDGSGLIFAANPRTAEAGLWWKSLARLDDPPVALASGPGEYADLAIARDTGSVVATVVDARQTLMRLEIGGDSPASFQAITNGFTGDVDPTFSPRGDRLVFSSARDGNRGLWSARPDGGDPRPLTTGGFDERPVLSPDGERVAFVSDRGGTRGIWVMNADGGAPRLVTQAQVLDHVSWSPDGRQLVYATPVENEPGLWLVAVDTGVVRRLPTPGPANSPAWSPRDDVIAYVEARRPTRGQPNSSRVAYVNSGGQPVHLDRPASPNVLNGFLAWSRDGRHLAAFVDPGASSGVVWLLDTAGHEAARKIADLPAGVRLRGAAWAPDGSSLVLGYIQRSSDIALFER
jgi:eukaryotic-like serine/threonine-protein kinase